MVSESFARIAALFRAKLERRTATRDFVTLETFPPPPPPAVLDAPTERISLSDTAPVLPVVLPPDRGG